MFPVVVRFRMSEV